MAAIFGCLNFRIIMLSFLLLHFTGLLTEGQKRQKPFVTEGDLVILKIFGAMLDENNKRGEQREQIMLGLVEKVIFRDVNVNQLCAHNVELGR